MLETKGLQKRFGRFQAVKNISFEVGKGEVLGFLGPNGAGKSTTMRMITGYLKPTAGTAVVAGHDILTDPIAAKKVIGYLPENAPVYGDMLVFDFLKFIAEIRGFSGRERIARAEGAIEKCHLNRVKYQSIETLSKGYRQRVCFAQALLHDPSVLIMDEPTDGLDPNQKQVVREMIREMSSDKVIVLSTHILEEVDAVCSRALIISNGSVVANGTPAELKRQSPSHGVMHLKLDNAEGDARAALEALPSVASVTIEDGVYAIAPADANQLFMDVNGLLKDKGWRPASLRVLEGRLDEVFLKLTTTLDAVRESDGEGS